MYVVASLPPPALATVAFLIGASGVTGVPSWTHSLRHKMRAEHGRRDLSIDLLSRLSCADTWRARFIEHEFSVTLAGYMLRGSGSSSIGHRWFKCRNSDANAITSCRAQESSATSARVGPRGCDAYAERKQSTDSRDNHSSAANPTRSTAGGRLSKGVTDDRCCPVSCPSSRTPTMPQPTGC